MPPTIWLSETQKIGIGLTGFGLIFTLFGVMMFFDGGLLAMGNILFMSGVTLVIGIEKTSNFFFQRRKLRGSICFFGGVILVFCRYPKIGLLIEAFGFMNLFGDFFPVVLSFVRRLPIIGRFFRIPGIRHLIDRLVGSKLPV